jgi:LPS export ABC transporter protein LptC
MMRKTSSTFVEQERQAKASSTYIVARRFCLTVLLDAFCLTSFACSSGVKPTATVTAADTADQVLVDMDHYVTGDGIVRARVRADTAYFYQNSQSAELRNVHVTFYGADGAETSTMTAREGTYHWGTGEGTGDMEGRGNVVVVGSGDGRTLKTEVMRYNQRTNEVSSDLPFVFDGPGRHMEGAGFTSDPNFRNVTAIRPRGTGGGFVLPNQ